MDTLPFVVGVAAILLGGAGVVGLLDRSGFRLYKAPGRAAPSTKHRLLQRLGGGLMLVVGVVFLVVALTG